MEITRCWRKFYFWYGELEYGIWRGKRLNRPLFAKSQQGKTRQPTKVGGGVGRVIQPQGNYAKEAARLGVCVDLLYE